MLFDDHLETALKNPRLALLVLLESLADADLSRLDVTTRDLITRLNALYFGEK